MTLGSRTMDEVKYWNNESTLNNAGITDKKIFPMISEFATFCGDYIAEFDKLSNDSDKTLADEIEEALSKYWKAILGALEQHKSGYQHQILLKEGYEKLAKFQADLEKRLAPENKISELPIVLYFEESDAARAIRFPFGSIRLIGIPLIDAKRRDWMAMPHELGHHVFWNAQFSEHDTTILSTPGTNYLAAEIKTATDQYAKDAQGMASEPVRQLLDDWTQEIFADVVGARIAGSEFINGVWDLISSDVKVKGKATISQKKALFENDGEHPLPYLRPYIRTFAQDTYFNNRWGEKFGSIDEYTKLETKDEPQAVIRISALRDYAMKTFVAGIVLKLRSLKFDKLVSGKSSLEELKEFIKQQSDKNESEKREMLISLLTPIILEKNLYWTCNCPRQRSSLVRKCPQCKKKKPGKQFWFVG